MEVVTEKMVTDKTLSDDPQTILKPCVEESVGNSDLGSVVVTTTVVERTEVSVVKESIGNEIEGLFGNLEGEDEGLKVDYCENGTSVGMDVEGSLAGENVSDINAIFEEKAGENGSDIDAVFEEKGGENGSDINAVFEEKAGVLGNEHDENETADPMDIFVPKEDMNMNMNHEEHVGEQAESEDHGFVVGDFVWGKIKSHPWWPGQIYDPSDASDYAAGLKREGQLLVAYFGDRSFSWCPSSQLKPFIDNFDKMSRQSDSKKFVYAVQNCLEEVSRRVEAELMRKCQTVNVTENAGVVNRGIKEGACAPKGNTVKVLVDGIKPVELVSTLKGYATMEPGTRLDELELAVLKSCLRAFYANKGGFLLVDYHDPKCIEGLEEETRSGFVADSDVNGPMGSPENGDDKLHQRRKQKSVAELMGEDESTIKKAKTTKDGGMKDRKRNVLNVLVTPESDYESGAGGGGGVEEDTMSPRQRKKSRYLSPPYLSPIGSGKFSVLGSGAGSGSFKEPKPESEKVPEVAAEQVEDAMKKSSGKKAREKRRVREGSDPQEHKMDADVSVAEVVDGLLCAALDSSSCVQKEKNLPTIMELVSSFRSSNFKEGTPNLSGKNKGSFKPSAKKKDNEDNSKKTGKKKDGEDSCKKAGKKKDGEDSFKKAGTKKDGEDNCKQTGKKKDGEDSWKQKTVKKKDGEDNCKQTGKKKDGENKDTSELGFIKQKLEWMSEMVQKCEENEMSADVKVRLEGGLQEVLGKVVKMRGK